MDAMTLVHPRWNEFASRLGGSEGCDFQAGKETWNCAGNYDLARKILADMCGIDIEGSIRFFEQNGGDCDCEILFNIDAPRYSDEWKL